MIALDRYSQEAEASSIKPASPDSLLSRLLEKYNVPAAPLTLLITGRKERGQALLPDLSPFH